MQAGVEAGDIVFSAESAPDIFDEIGPLIQLHYLEVARYQDIPLAPDWNAYARAQEAGKVRVFTARLKAETSIDMDASPGRDPLVGYAVYFVSEHLHHKGSLQALSDVIFMHPGFRGQGLKLIRYAEDALRLEGVQVVYQHVKAAHNFGPALQRKGYELVDLIYAKRLDKEAV